MKIFILIYYLSTTHGLTTNSIEFTDHDRCVKAGKEILTTFVVGPGAWRGGGYYCAEK